MKKFLGSFAALAAAFAADASLAAHLPVPASPVAPLEPITAAATLPSENVSITAEGERYEFLLKRADATGQLMAYHRSHASHASHASYASHYSGR